MARKLRVEYPGAMYQVMNRGDQRELIFKVDAGRERFLATKLKELKAAQTKWESTK